MSGEKQAFAEDEQEFLAAFALFEKPIEVDLAAAIKPLSPGRILRVLERAVSLGWLEKHDAGTYGFSSGYRSEVEMALERLGQPERLAEAAGAVDDFGAWTLLWPEIRSEIFKAAGREDEAAILLAEEGRQAIDRNSLGEGYRCLQAALELLDRSDGRVRFGPDFISAALDFSSLSFSLGRDLGLAERYLLSAEELAGGLGDLRSTALIRLHLGRLYYLSDRRLEAIMAFKDGQRLVEELGDADIRLQAAEFIGMNYFVQGLHDKAVEPLDLAAQAFEAGESNRLMNPSAPMYLGYCASYLGQFHRAVGCLDSAWRRARGDVDKSLSSVYRATLGTVLLQIGRMREGFYHIKSALSEAETSGNAVAKYAASGGLAYYHFLHNRFREARDILANLLREGAASGIRRQFASPYVLEMIFEFERQGMELITDFSFNEQVQRLMNEPSVHLKGVAWRLLARERLMDGDRTGEAPDLLKKSEEYLIQAHDPIQLAKTRAEMARMALGRGDKEKARQLALKARRGLSGHSESFFPDELRALLKDLDLGQEDGLNIESITQQVRMIVGSIPSTSFDDNLDFIVRELNRLLGAERGALFWVDEDPKKELMLRAGRNLSEADTLKPSFEPHWRVIHRVVREKRPRMERNRASGPQGEASGARSVLCLPIVLNDKPRGVLYYDNSYLTDFFDLLEDSILEKLAADISRWVERVVRFTGALEEAERRTIEISVERELAGRDEIIGGQSPAMSETLALADKAARSEGNVLIQGETGVGKELLARRIHENSPRSKKPFVTVDLTTIPENLTESELFGYEKGAFTGADARKAGRIELAHFGTLFIDEITEIPVNIQTKLLRVLQEKTFVRIGGNNPQKSDFRLIVATNRDLESEVREGRFRQDLYYRLNTIKLVLPPLRERKEDAILLAHFFLNRFAKKYNRPDLAISRSEEKLLRDYSWPGNVRELRNLIERAVILSDGQDLDLKMPNDKAGPGLMALDDDPTLEEVQRRYITHVLKKTRGRIGGPGGAAEILGMKRTSLYTRMKKLGMSKTS